MGTPVQIPPLPGQKNTPHTVFAFRSSPPHATTAGSLHGPPRAQDNIKDSILGDCLNAVYECSYDAMTQLLNGSHISNPPSLPDDWGPSLILDVNDERRNYRPLVEWLNEATRTSPSTTNHIQFLAWDRPVRTSIKPDAVVALLAMFLSGKVLKSWHDAAGVLEVKGEWKEVLQEAFTYARKLLNAGNRWLAPLIIKIRKCASHSLRISESSSPARPVLRLAMGVARLPKSCSLWPLFHPTLPGSIHRSPTQTGCFILCSSYA